MHCILICFINTHRFKITYNRIDVSRHSSERINRLLTISYGKDCITFRTNQLSTRFLMRITFDIRDSNVLIFSTAFPIIIISLLISITTVPINIVIMLLLLSTPLHQRAASRVQHPKSCGSQQSLPPGGKERLHFVGIRPEVQARKGGW